MRMGTELSLFFLLFLRLNDVLNGEDEKYECSDYYFGKNAKDQSWKAAKALCKRDQQAVLASVESNEEWEYLKNITTNTNHRWYIGLKYVPSSNQWCWLSNSDACLNETSSKPGKWRWHQPHEPNNLDKEHCVEMFPTGEFNNIACEESFTKRSLGDGGYICEKKDCVDKTTVQPYTTERKYSSGPVTQEPSVHSNRPIKGGAKTSATTAEISTTAKAIKQTSNYITSTKPNIYSATGSGKQKTIMRSSTQDKELPVYHPTDDSNRENQSPSITIIVVAVLAVLLVIVLAVSGYVIWRKRSSSSKEREDQMDDSNVIHGIRLESVPGQGPHEQTQPLQNEISLREDKKEEVPHLYAIVEKRNKAAHRSSGMSATQYPVPDDDEQICVTSNPPSEPSLERKDHIYANTNQADPKRKPPVYPKPYAVPQKRPTEHADNTNGKEQYLYAAVDKTRKRNSKDEPSTCGPVYAELGFNPSQDEDETEITAQDSFTVYASIQEGQ